MHAAAILHPKLRTALRKTMGTGQAIILSAKKMSTPCMDIDLALHYQDAALVHARGHRFGPSSAVHRRFEEKKGKKENGPR